jgi:hypothetical protein
MMAMRTDVTAAKGLVKAAGLAAVCVLATGTQGFAQDAARTGVSRPDPVVITTTDDSSMGVAQPVAKPSAAVPLSAAQQPYVASSQTIQADPAQTVPTAVPVRRPLPANDPDAGIVTYVPSAPGEVPDGTLVKVKLREEISSLTTRPGTKFTATVSEPVMRDGRVVVPVGSMLEGRVTGVRGGRRVGGSAAIHLEPQTVTLPDGSRYVLHARAIDTSSWGNTKVDSEGTILRKDKVKGTVEAMGLATGGGAAAGAMIGGVPGALIGAGVGAGISTVVWLKEDRQAVLPKDLGVVFSLTLPMRVTPADEAATRNMMRPGGE